MIGVIDSAIFSLIINLHRSRILFLLAIATRVVVMIMIRHQLLQDGSESDEKK
jgi:hypothetical protein